MSSTHSTGSTSLATMANSRDVMRARFAAQLLVESTAQTPHDVVHHLLAVQAQDPRGMRLSVRPRCRRAVQTDIDRALTEGSLVVGWLNRGTLHLVCAEDYWWLHAITTPQLRTGNARRLLQEGVDEDAGERGVQVIESALAAHGPCTRAQLRSELDAANVPTARQALVHLLLRASIAGIAVRGPMRGNEQAFVGAHSWLGPPPRIDRDQGYADLASRYLRGHGPADDRDLAKWAGIGLRPARTGLGTTPGLVTRKDGLWDLAERDGAAGTPRPTLLGPFDPLLLGWQSRDAVIGVHKGLVTSNGLFRPFALVKGRAVATWRLRGSDVALEPLEPITPRDLRALDEDAADVARYVA